MSQLLSYVGPPEILEAARHEPAGHSLCVPDDLQLWIGERRMAPNQRGYFIMTYVVDLDGWMLIAPRRSEHVACASGQPVLAAGEVSFGFDMVDGSLYVTEISNQSTGYCPPLSCWSAVKAALDRVPLGHPGEFTHPFVFRRCPSCHERNLVKDDWYVCELCGANLPEAWNFATLAGD